MAGRGPIAGTALAEPCAPRLGPGPSGLHMGGRGQSGPGGAGLKLPAVSRARGASGKLFRAAKSFSCRSPRETLPFASGGNAVLEKVAPRVWGLARM